MNASSCRIIVMYTLYGCWSMCENMYLIHHDRELHTHDVREENGSTEFISLSFSLHIHHTYSNACTGEVQSLGGCICTSLSLSLSLSLWTPLHRWTIRQRTKAGHPRRARHEVQVRRKERRVQSGHGGACIEVEVDHRCTNVPPQENGPSLGMVTAG